MLIRGPRTVLVWHVHGSAGRTDIPIVHVTDFNRLMWDNGRAPVTVTSTDWPIPASCTSVTSRPGRR